MRIVFLQDVPRQGQAGDVKEVANGYARNYLIPKGLAALATPQEMKRIQKIKKVGEERRLKIIQDLQELAKALEGTSITIKAKAGPTGRFFGSITSAQIAQELTKVIDREVDRKSVELAEPIHEPGSYSAVVQLYSDVKATVTVVAQAEEAIAEEESAAPEEPTRSEETATSQE